MAGDERIHIKVSPEQKEQWKAHAEEEHRSLSDLIRKAVQRYITMENHESGSQSGEAPEELLRSIDNMNSNVVSLADELQGVKRELRSVKAAVEEPDESVRDVSNRILDALPEITESPTDAEIEAITDPNNPLEAGNPPNTVDQLADTLDEPPDVIREAIDLLESETYMIQSDVQDGTTHYWRDE